MNRVEERAAYQVLLRLHTRLRTRDHAFEKVFQILRKPLTALDLNDLDLSLSDSCVLLDMRARIQLVIVVVKNDVAERFDAEVVLEEGVEVARIAMTRQTHRPGRRAPAEVCQLSLPCGRSNLLNSDGSAAVLRYLLENRQACFLTLLSYYPP